MPKSDSASASIASFFSFWATIEPIMSTEGNGSLSSRVSSILGRSSRIRAASAAFPAAAAASASASTCFSSEVLKPRPPRNSARVSRNCSGSASTMSPEVAFFESMNTSKARSIPSASSIGTDRVTTCRSSVDAGSRRRSLPRHVQNGMSLSRPDARRSGVMISCGSTKMTVKVRPPSRAFSSSESVSVGENGMMPDSR